MSETKYPEWIWYREEENGNRLVTFGRWPKHNDQMRYKIAEIQPTEHDHKNKDYVSVPKELLAMVLDQAWSDSRSFEGEWASSAEEHAEFAKEREPINKLRSIAGIEFEE